MKVRGGKGLIRDILIYPMNPHPEHAFGRLSGYIDAYWLYTQKMRKEGHNPFVYLSHNSCFGNPAKCMDGYIWHETGLRWHFEIVKDGTFVGKKLADIVKTGWAKYVPPFRKYPDDTYWFLLKNLRKLKEKSIIYGKRKRGGRVLSVDKFYREIDGYGREMHSSAFRSSFGAPWVVKCAIEPPSELDFEQKVDPFRELMVQTVTKRGGIDEQTIEETFLLKILWDGFEHKRVDAVWKQEGFTDEEADRYRFDMAFRLDDGTHFAVEFKKGYGEDAPLQLANYINKIPLLKCKKPNPIVVCAIKTDELMKQMKQAFPQAPWRIMEFKPEIRFEDV